MGQPIGEAEAVVDVMNVTVADAEVLLDLLRVQDLPISDELTRARSEAIGDLQ